MAHFMNSSDNKYPDLSYDDDYRSHLITRRNSPNKDSFGRRHGKRVHSAMSRFNSVLKNMIDTITGAKMRRLERELELHGIRYDRPRNNWTTRTPSDPAEG
jgi:hypothetical protein